MTKSSNSKSNLLTPTLLLIAFQLIAINCSTNTVQGLSPFKRQTLVLLDSDSLLASHSLFFSDLRSQGFNLTFQPLSAQAVQNSQIKLSKDKEYLYDNLILIASSIESLPSTSDFDLQKFYDDGRNILFMADVDSSSYFRQLLNTFGVNLARKGSYVVDYQQSLNKQQPNVFECDTSIMKSMFPQDFQNQKGDQNQQQSQGVIYNGIGMDFTYYDNTQISVFLRGSQTSASVRYDEMGRKSVLKIGQDNALVAGVQGINNARMLVSGSVDIFSNELYIKSKGANQKFGQLMSSWFAQELGMLRKVKHEGICMDQQGQQGDCPVYSKMKFELMVEQWDRKSNQWTPYRANNESFYLESKLINMMSREKMQEDQHQQGRYVLNSTMPERMGTYHWIVHYARPGYSFIDVYQRVFVRPWHHKEYIKNYIRDLPSLLSVIGIGIAFCMTASIYLFDSSRKELP